MTIKCEGCDVEIDPPLDTRCACQPEPSADMARLTGEWVPVLPKAFEKSVVLGGGKVLFPCHDPQKTAELLREHILEVARRAYQQGKRDAKIEIRKVIFN